MIDTYYFALTGLHLALVSAVGFVYFGSIRDRRVLGPRWKVALRVMMVITFILGMLLFLFAVLVARGIVK